MKNVIKNISICLLATLVLASCTSKSSLIKRHYTKGYYVSHTKTLDAKAKNSSYIAQEKTNELALANENEVEQMVIAKTESPLLASSNAMVIVNQQNQNVKTNSITNFNTKTRSKTPSFNFLQRNAEVNKSSENIIGTASSDGDGLSFFGFIVLLVIILWALGFYIGGLGSLIHLLLIIALVLLILWLLRVI